MATLSQLQQLDYDHPVRVAYRTVATAHARSPMADHPHGAIADVYAEIAFDAIDAHLDAMGVHPHAR